MMFNNEENVNSSIEKKIEAEFKQGLLNANQETETENSSSSIPAGELPKSRTGFLDKWYVEQFCHIKNNFIAQKLSHDLNQDGKSLAQEVYTATPEEIDAYLALAEYGCTSLMPSEWLDSMERFFKHPASAVARVEVMKFRSLNKKLAMFRVKTEEVKS